MGGNLVVNILDKISTYAETNVQVNAQILTATKKTNEILSREIHKELTKQTSLLENLIKAVNKKPGGDTNFSLFGGQGKMAKTFAKFFEEIKPAKINAMGKAMEFLAGGIVKFSDAINNIDEKKLELASSFFTKISKGIALLTFTVAIAAPILLVGTLVTLPLILLWGTTFNLLGKYEKNLDKGSDALKTIGIGIGLLGLAVAGYIFFNGGLKGAMINSIVVAISLFVMTLPMIFIAKNSKNLVKAAIGVALMSLSIFLLGMSVNSYFEALGGNASDPASMLLASATIAGSLLIIGIGFAILGKLASQIIIGGVSMIIAGVSVLILAKAVETWMSAKPTWEAIGMLGAAIVGLGVAMAGFGLAAMFIIPGAAALLIASTGLFVFTKSLVNYKEAKWKEKDTDSMIYTLENTLTGFIGIFDDLSFGDIAKAMMGTVLLGSLGNSLSSFAAGLAAFASGQEPEYAVKDGKLVLVGTKPLGKDLGIRAGETIKALLEPLIGQDSVLYKLGEEQGLLFDGPVGNGIDLLGRLGNSLSNFALGVQAMANLQVPTYEVKDGKLILKGTKPLDPNFAKKVAENIDMIISSLMDPIKKLGENSGFLFDSDFEDGLEMLGEIGEPIADLSEGIIAFSKIDAKGIKGKEIAETISELIQGLHKAFSKESGYNKSQSKNLSLFAETIEDIADNIDLETKGVENLSKAFVNIKSSVNEIDMKKLSSLNKLMINFNKLANTLKESFDDVDEILDKLISLIENLTKLKEEGTSGEIKTPQTGSAVLQAQLPESIKVSNIDEVIESLDDLKNVLLGTLDVRVEDNLINR